MSDELKDGDIVERLPGVYFQWDSSTNSWIRLNGFMSVKKATPVSSGLMPKEDFIKLQRILTAPPKTTLTSVQCNATFDGGVIQLVSRDFSMFIEDYLDLKGNNTVSREQWKIHEDTYGFNFRVNLNNLITEMKNRGNLIAETVVGPTGLKGDRGEPGIDKLDTGPKGDKGEDGTNAGFEGDLINATQFSNKETGKAVVDVGVETISPDENYLVVYKGSISPDDLCTRRVNVGTDNSGWTIASAGNILTCGDGCVKCDDIVHFDMDLIVDSIKNHTDEMIKQAKEDREQKALEWMRTMIKVFNDQKEALCCALENCRSRTRNSTERKFIESQRIAAASAEFSLNISDPKSGTGIDMDPGKPNCISITEVIAGSPIAGVSDEEKSAQDAFLNNSIPVKWALIMPTSLGYHTGSQVITASDVVSDQWFLVPYYGCVPNETILQYRRPTLNNTGFIDIPEGINTIDGPDSTYVRRVSDAVLEQIESDFGYTFNRIQGRRNGEIVDLPVGGSTNPGVITNVFATQTIGIGYNLPNRGAKNLDTLFVSDTSGVAPNPPGVRREASIRRGRDFIPISQFPAWTSTILDALALPRPGYPSPDTGIKLLEFNNSFPNKSVLSIVRNSRGLPRVDTTNTPFLDPDVYFPPTNFGGGGPDQAEVSGALFGPSTFNPAYIKAISEFWSTATGDYEFIGNHADSGMPVFVSPTIDIPPLVALQIFGAGFDIRSKAPGGGEIAGGIFTNFSSGFTAQPIFSSYINAHISERCKDEDGICCELAAFYPPINPIGGCPDRFTIDDIAVSRPGSDGFVTFDDLETAEFPPETFTTIVDHRLVLAFDPINPSIPDPDFVPEQTDPRRKNGGTFDIKYYYGEGLEALAGQIPISQYSAHLAGTSGDLSSAQNASAIEHFKSRVDNDIFRINTVLDGIEITKTMIAEWHKTGQVPCNEEQEQVIEPSESAVVVNWVVYSDTTSTQISNVWKILPVVSCVPDNKLLSLDTTSATGVVLNEWLVQNPSLRESGDLSQLNGLYGDSWVTESINQGGSYGHFTLTEITTVFDDGCNKVTTSVPRVDWDPGETHPIIMPNNLYSEDSDEYSAINRINSSIAGKYTFVGNHRNSRRPVYRKSGSIRLSDLEILFGNADMVTVALEACQ